MDPNTNPASHSGSQVESIVTTLCKGVIEAAHAAGAEGISDQEAFCEFRRRGVSFAQFNLFIESMARAGLIARVGESLRATVRGLAYAGVDARSPSRASRPPAP